eukprot:gene30956-17155_t
MFCTTMQLDRIDMGRSALTGSLPRASNVRRLDGRRRIHVLLHATRFRGMPISTGFLGFEAASLTLKMKTKRISKKLILEAETPAVALPPRFLKDMRYSSRAIKARAKVVHLVMEGLSQQGEKSSEADSSSSISNPVLELVIERGDAVDLCGALIVLLELKGEDAQIISAGSTFLKHKPITKGLHTSVITRDIALSVSLAHRNLAASYRVKPDGTALEDAYRHAIDGLSGLAVLYAQRLLEHKPSRKMGLQAVKESTLLLAVSSQQRTELLSKVNRLLSAAEVVAVYEALAELVTDDRLTEPELYELALANMAEGADSLLEEITKRSGKALDVVLERAVCKPEEATAKLVDAPESFPGFPSTRQSNKAKPIEVDSTRKAEAERSSASGEAVAKSVAEEGRDVAEEASASGVQSRQLGAEDSALVVLVSEVCVAKSAAEDSAVVVLSVAEESALVVLDNQSEDAGSQQALESWAESWMELSVLSNYQDLKVPAAAPPGSKGSPPREDSDTKQKKGVGEDGRDKSKRLQGCRHKVEQKPMLTVVHLGGSIDDFRYKKQKVAKLEQTIADGGPLGSLDGLRSSDGGMQLWVEDATGKIKPRTVARVVDAKGTDRGITLERQAWLNAVKEVAFNSARVAIATALLGVVFFNTRGALQATVQMTVPLPAFGTSTKVSLHKSVDSALEAVNAAQRSAAIALDPAAADQLLVAYLSVRATVMRSPRLAERLLPSLLEGQALTAARQQAQLAREAGSDSSSAAGAGGMGTVEVVQGKNARLTASVRETGSYQEEGSFAQSTSKPSKADKYKTSRTLDVVLKYDARNQLAPCELVLSELALYDLALHDLTLNELALYVLAPCKLALSELALYELALHDLALNKLAPCEVALYELASCKLVLSELALHQLALYELALHDLALYKLVPCEVALYELALNKLASCKLVLCELALYDLAPYVPAPCKLVLSELALHKLALYVLSLCKLVLSELALHKQSLYVLSPCKLVLSELPLYYRTQKPGSVTSKELRNQGVRQG